MDGTSVEATNDVHPDIQLPSLSLLSLFFDLIQPEDIQTRSYCIDEWADNGHDDHCVSRVSNTNLPFIQLRFRLIVRDPGPYGIHNEARGRVGLRCGRGS